MILTTYSPDSKFNSLLHMSFKHNATCHKIYCREYIEDIHKTLILNSPKLAALYALYVTRGKFPEGEPIIATNIVVSYYYATNIICERFELGESIIAKDIFYAEAYATNLKFRFEIAEPAIAENSFVSYRYARNVIDGKFELGEPAIAKDPYNSYYYAIYVLKSDFVLDGKLIYDCHSKPDVLKTNCEER